MTWDQWAILAFAVVYGVLFLCDERKRRQGNREFRERCEQWDREMADLRAVNARRRALENTGPLPAECGPVNVDADGREVE